MKLLNQTKFHCLLLCIVFASFVTGSAQESNQSQAKQINLFEWQRIDMRLQFLHAIDTSRLLDYYLGDEPGVINVVARTTQGDEMLNEMLVNLRYQLDQKLAQMDKEEVGNEMLVWQNVLGPEVYDFATADWQRSNYCADSDPFCTSEIYTFPAGVGGVAETGPYYGCLTRQPNPAWYHMKIGVAGSLTISMFSTPSHDIDFICWGPFDDPVSPCTSGLTSDKVIDCSYSIASGEDCVIPNAILNKYYILLITNFSNQPCNITFQKTAGTGATDCSIVPPPISSNSPVCVGGQLQLSAENVNGASFLWTGPNGFSSTLQNPVINNVTMANAGTYTLVITVGGIQSNPVTLDVVINPTPIPDFIYNEACLGDPTVFTDASTTNPPSGQITSWMWAFGDGTVATGQNQTHLYAAAGNYQVTLTTFTGTSQCEQSITKQVMVKMKGDANAGNDVTIPNGWITNLNGTATGGSGNYSYHWEPQSLVQNPNAAQTPTHPLSATTLFTLSVTDNSGGCVDEDQVLVTVTGLPFAINVVSDQSVICAGESTILHANASGGSGNYTYSWTSNPVGFTSNLPNPVVSPTQNTIYYVTVFDGQNTLNGQVSVNVGAITQANAGPDITIPTGWNTTLEGSVSGGSGSYQINWQPQALLVNHTVLQPTTVPLSSTTVFTLTITDNDGGCTSSDQAVVTVSGGALSVQVAALPSTICQGAQSQLSASASGGSGSYTYLWTTVPASSWTSNLQNPVVSPTATTVYHVVVNDGQNSVSAQLTLTVGAVTTANAGPDITIPEGASAQLLGSVSGGSGSYSVSWEPHNLLLNPNLIQPTTVPLFETRFFHLTVTDNSSGCLTTDQMTVIVSGALLAVAPSAEPATICVGQSAHLYANASGGSGNYTYQWTSDPPGFTADVANPVVSPTETTHYFVEVSDGSSTIGGQTTVAVGASSVADAGPDLVADYGWPVTLQGQVTGDQNFSFSWYNEDLLVNPNLLTPQTTPLTGPATFILTVTNNQSQCTTSDQMLVTINGGPLGITAYATTTNICQGEQVQLHVMCNGGSGVYTYQWNSSTGFHSNLQNPTVEPMVSSTYIVTVSDGMNSVSDQVSITVKLTPQANAGPNIPINVGTCAILQGSASGGTGNYFYQWSPADSLNNPGADQHLPQPQTKILMNDTKFTLTVNDLNGCSSQPSSMWVLTGGSALSLVAEATEEVICNGSSTQLLATPYGGSGNYTYHWTTNNNSWESTLQSPEVSPHMPTTYTLVVNDGYMDVTAQVHVTVHPVPVVNITPASFVPVDNTIFVCVRDSVTLDAGPGFHYLWMNGATSRKQRAFTNGNWIDVQTWRVRVTDPATNCQTRDSLIVFFDFNTCNIGLEELDLGNRIKISPNPSNGKFTLAVDRLPGQLTIEVCSPIGAPVYAEKVAMCSDCLHTTSIDLSDHPAGVYLLVLVTDRFVLSRKLIKK